MKWLLLFLLPSVGTLAFAWYRYAAWWMRVHPARGYYLDEGTEAFSLVLKWIVSPFWLPIFLLAAWLKGNAFPKPPAKVKLADKPKMSEDWHS